ncbi:MAG: DMT family protein [Alphaproteobacteria bacterium]
MKVNYTSLIPVTRSGKTAMNIHPIASTAGLLILSNIFMTFAAIYMKEPLRWDYLWAALCILGAVFFIFRPSLMELWYQR